MALKQLIGGQFYNSSSGGGSPGGSNGQVQYNNSGAFGGLTGLTTSGGVLQTGAFAGNGAVSSPPLSLTGTWFSGGSATTTKPQFLVEPSGTTSTGWSTDGTGLGVNAASGFAGLLFDGHVAGVPAARLFANGSIVAGNSISAGAGYIQSAGDSAIYAFGLLMRNDAQIGWSSTSGFSGTKDLYLTRKAAATLQLGIDAAGVVNQMITAANRITSDGVGAHIKIAGGNGLGGAGGSVILSTYTTAATGVAGTLTDRLTIDTTGLITTQGLTIAPPSGNNTSITATTGNSLTLATLDSNKDIILSPHGTGKVLVGVSGADAWVAGTNENDSGLFWEAAGNNRAILKGGGTVMAYLAGNTGCFEFAVVPRSTGDATTTLGDSARRWSQGFFGPTGLKIGDGTSGPSITASGSSPNEDFLLNTVGSGTLDITGVVTASETVTVDKTLTIKVNGTAIKIPYVNA